MLQEKLGVGLWLPAAASERPCVLQGGDRAVLGEASLVPSSPLSRAIVVISPLGDTNFDASPDEVEIDRDPTSEMPSAQLGPALHVEPFSRPR